MHFAIYPDANYEKIDEIENIFRKKIIGNLYGRYINCRLGRLTLITSSPSIRAAVNLTSAKALLVDAGNHLMRDLNDGLSRRCLEGGVYLFLCRVSESSWDRSSADLAGKSLRGNK